MKIRIMGTQEECEQARRYYSQFLNSDIVSHCSISRLYPNRNSVNQYRMYIDISSNFDFMNTSSANSAKAYNAAAKALLNASAKAYDSAAKAVLNVKEGVL